MAGGRAVRVRLVAWAILLGMAGVVLATALFLYARGLQWANEFSGAAAFLLAVGVALSPLAGKMWKLIRHGDAESAHLTVEQAVAGLRTALKEEWRQEEDFRKVNSPWPLPVRWHVGNSTRTAMLGISWREVGERGRSVTASKLKGSFEDIGEAFTTTLPRRRLVVLGGPGSGKTMLVVRLARELLADRSAGGLLPVLLSASGWQADQLGVADFAESQLVRDRPGLGGLVDRVGGQVTLARALVNSDEVLLILDGLDEIPPSLRTQALRRLSDYPADKPMVITSRPEEYTQAVGAIGRGLPGAAVVELQGLCLEDIGDYLIRATSAPDSRWQSLLEYLDQHSSGDLAEVLQVPLMVWLTRTVYASPDTNPAELIQFASSGRKTDIEKHLLNKLIPSLYDQSGDYQPRTSRTWKPEEAEKWLRFLAWHLQLEDSYDFAWWDLNRRVPRAVHGIFGGIPIGAPIGLAIAVILGIARDPVAGLAYGLAAGAGVAILAGFPGSLSSWRQMEPAKVEVRIRGNLLKLAVKLGLGVLFGFGFGTLIGLPVTLLYGLRYGVLIALTLGLAIGLALTLRQLFEASNDVSAAISPDSLLRDDTVAAIVQTSMGCIGLGVGAGIALYGTVKFGPAIGIATLVGYGLAYGVTFGLGLRTARVSTPAFLTTMIARGWLMVQRKLPARLMLFLKDAHILGILRQQGSVYQFRHARLREFLTSS